MNTPANEEKEIRDQNGELIGMETKEVMTREEAQRRYPDAKLPPTPANEWRKEFDFVDSIDRELVIEKVNQLLTTHSAHLVERIEGMKEKLEDADYYIGYNQALDQAITILRKE